MPQAWLEQPGAEEALGRMCSDAWMKLATGGASSNDSDSDESSEESEGVDEKEEDEDEEEEEEEEEEENMQKRLCHGLIPKRRQNLSGNAAAGKSFSFNFNL